METKKKKYYKPGQLVTIDNRIYRIVKGWCILCPFRNEPITYKPCRICITKIHGCNGGKLRLKLVK